MPEVGFEPPRPDGDQYKSQLSTTKDHKSEMNTVTYTSPSSMDEDDVEEISSLVLDEATAQVIDQLFSTMTATWQFQAKR